jgi:hypothetical protein
MKEYQRKMLPTWVCGTMEIAAKADRREGAGSHERGDNGSGAFKGFKDGTAFKIRGTGGSYGNFQISFGELLKR